MVVSDLVRILGNEAVQFSQAAINEYLQNVCVINRKILGVVYPNSDTEVQALVRYARTMHVPL